MTLTLVAFLVLLLVGLATYARIETAVAGNQQRQAQARENALFALQVALGQLQKHAGPDTRATATGNSTGSAGARHYTGVWDSATPGSGPLTWLVSGSEQAGATPDTVLAAALDPSSNATADQEFLVGSRTVTDNADRIKVAKQDIAAPGVPGQAGAVRIGRYAWWVGDQGVKAPVAVADTTDAITFAPYDTADARARIRQQIALGAGAANATTGAPVFEPRDASNAPLVANEKISSASQLAFLRTAATGTPQLGAATVRQNFHAWSPNNFAVLADTARGGLREDLSLNPGRLGAAFSAWARYDRPRAVAMEPLVQPMPVVGVDPPGPMPPYGSDPLRRRFFITPNVTGGGVEGGIHPVLAFFGISFSIRAPTAPNYEVSARCVIGLWNPHSSSLVPPAGSNGRIELHVTGLPDVLVRDSLGGGGTVPLQGVMGGPLRFSLAWPDEPAREDEASWLPGRIYYWTAESNATEPADGNLMRYNERNATAVGGAGIVRPAGVTHAVPPPNATLFRQCSVANGDNTTLRVQLVRPGGSQPGVLATFESPRFRDFQTTPDQLEVQHSFMDFAFVFRLPDPAEIPEGESATWLSAARRDPRRSFLPGSAFVAGENGPQPELYGGPNVTGLATSFPSRLLDRSTGSRDYNEDVPLFELPRGPFLSMGALQHLIIPDARPFAIGNPWGTGVEVNGTPANALFDRFFFSGLVQDLVPATSATGDLILPSPLLKPLRKPDAAKLAIEDIRNMANPPDTTDPDGNVIPGGPGSSLSSKFFLQGGAFNLNSTSSSAWAAELRGVRFPAPEPFAFHDVSAETGTAADDARATLQSDDAQFLRFSLSAQETFKAEWPPATADAGVTPPRTDRFRKGMRTLSSAQVVALAGKITELMRMKHAAAGGLGGPFRSVEEFLSPSPLFAGLDPDGNALASRSLLEAAIADAGVNADLAEFSSQFLTQADIMTALAPVLFPRSDTFFIRTYGEAWNPVTATAEGRAWCEAVVQRVPEYFDPSAATGDAAEVLPAALVSPLNQQLGRRFKVVSFRWLTRSDI